MCGIVGYTGQQQAAPVLLEGLKKLEYRGYDSAGIAVMQQKKIAISKVTGRIAGNHCTDGQLQATQDLTRMHPRALFPDDHISIDRNFGAEPKLWLV